MGFMVAVIACAGTLSAALTFYYLHLGDNNILLETTATYDLVVQYDLPGREIHCRCLIPLSNKGKQQGMVNNVFCQPVYCGKVMKKLEIISHLHLTREPSRENGYWESLILKTNDYFITELEVVIRSQVPIPSLLQEVPRLTILIYYQVVGRKGIQWRLAELPLPLKRKIHPRTELKKVKGG